MMNIETLAFEKDFAALDAAERARVLAEMPQVEYEQLRSILLAARQMDATVKPPAFLREQLLDGFVKSNKPSLFSKVIQLHIPAWQVAAALLLVMGVVWLYPRREIVREQGVTQIQIRVDTLWREKIQWRERVVWRNRLVYRDAPAAFTPVKADTVLLPVAFSPVELAKSNIGTSLGDAPELMDFFTQGDK